MREIRTQDSVKNYVSDEIGPLAYRPCLLIVALAVKNPDHKIPDADECEQSSQQTPKPNLAPLAEHAVEDKIEPMKRSRESVSSDVPILESRHRPEKECANQLSP